MMELSIKQVFEQGMAAYNECKFQKAESLYHRVLEKHPAHSAANHNLGAIAASCGKYEDALPFFKNAIAINNKQEQYWISLLEALIKLGKIHDARVAISQAQSAVFESEKITSLSLLLNQPNKLDFFYRYLEELGVFSSIEGKLLNGDLEPIPLLTSSFLSWFETQNWNSLNLLELGAGGSTLYFAKFFESVTSVETNKKWFDELLLKIPSNVNLVKASNILDTLQENYIGDIHSFDVILIDASENRAKLTRWLVNRGYKGIIFFDNAEWYRKSVGIFLEEDFLEIPFFGLKPVEDWVSCTSVLADPATLSSFLTGDWVSLPKLSWELDNSWDDENDRSG